MIVLARRFAWLPKLGRYSDGEYVEKSTEMDDSLAPVSHEEAAQRSVKAMRHHWSELENVEVKVTSVTQTPHGWIARGKGWSVSWRLPSFDADFQDTLDKIAGAPSFEAAFAVLADKVSKNHTMEFA